MTNNMGMSITIDIFASSAAFVIGLTMHSATYDRLKDYGTPKATVLPAATLLGWSSPIDHHAVIGYCISLGMLIVTKIGCPKRG